MTVSALPRIGNAVTWVDDAHTGRTMRGHVWSEGPLPSTWWAICVDQSDRQALVLRTADGYERVPGIPLDWPAQVARAEQWARTHHGRLVSDLGEEAWRPPLVHVRECRQVRGHQVEGVLERVGITRVLTAFQVPENAPDNWPLPRSRARICQCVRDAASLAAAA